MSEAISWWERRVSITAAGLITTTAGQDGDLQQSCKSGRPMPNDKAHSR